MRNSTVSADPVQLWIDNQLDWGVVAAYSGKYKLKEESDS